MLAVLGMFVTQTRRHQQFEFFSQQLFAAVAEQLFHLRVDQNNSAFAIDHHDRVGCRFQQSPELGLGTFALGDVAAGGDDVRSALTGAGKNRG